MNIPGLSEITSIVRRLPYFQNALMEELVKVNQNLETLIKIQQEK